MTWFVVLWLLTQVPSGGCGADVYRRLDFWVGSWDVRVADGTRVGTSIIEKTLSGCAILEHWRDGRGSEGKSLFYYHSADARWKQVWVTDGGAVKEKRMVDVSSESVRFQGELCLAGGSVLDRTTLTPLPDGRVRQVIEQSADGGVTWETGFDAYYFRVP